MWGGIPARVRTLLSRRGKKENDLLKQQNAIQEKLTELAKREAEVYRVAFEKEKELTDRALKLAEIGKPESNWELQRISDFKLQESVISVCNIASLTPEFFPFCSFSSV